jgi:hypothetical protein
MEFLENKEILYLKAGEWINIDTLHERPESFLK